MFNIILVEFKKSHEKPEKNSLQTLQCITLIERFTDTRHLGFSFGVKPQQYGCTGNVKKNLKSLEISAIIYVTLRSCEEIKHEI